MEAHPRDYIAKLNAVFHELKRILRGDGTFYLNMGDTYAGSGKGAGTVAGKESWRFSTKPKLIENRDWIQPKQLMLIPARVAMALQEDG